MWSGDLPPKLARLAGRLLDQMARFEVRSQLIMSCGEPL